ncbi:MAG: hypothetical protein HY079_12775 [Elusimicrobia bacterium]|nr:hypothetical protein [Elusimicrobiota bacterium]
MTAKFRSAVLVVALVGGTAFSSSCRKPAARPDAKPADLPIPTAGGKTPTPDPDAELKRLIEKKYAADPAERDAMLRDVDKMGALDAVERTLADKYRRTMIVPAPADFRPEAVGRKVRLRLVLESARIKRGTRPRFRLEMMNVGREALDYHEDMPGLFVAGAELADSDVMTFFITDPHGKRVRVIGGRALDRQDPPGRSDRLEPAPAGMSPEQERRWFTETAAMSEASMHFTVRLMPGEILHNLGDPDSPRENFRTLRTQHDFFKEPGTYRLAVVLDDRPTPLTKTFIKAALESGSTLDEIQRDQAKQAADALGPLSSNAATYELVP